ncbi:MAG: hypothetical protein U0165_08510 [Polyangiaceae bacterium]
MPSRQNVLQHVVRDPSPDRDHFQSLSRPAAMVALVASVLLLGSGVATAGIVKGKVTGADKLLNPVWNEAKDPAANRYSFREPSPTVRAEFRQLFAYAPKEICIAALGSSAAAAPEKPLLFKIGGGRTNPVTLVVAPGTTLEFLNNDPFPHRPYIKGNATFAAAEMKGKSSRQWKVPAGAAVYELLDELAPSVHSYIVSEPNVAGVAFPQRDNSFTFFNGLPSGDYSLQAFFNGKKVGTPRQVSVKGDAPVEVKDALQVGEAGAKEKELSCSLPDFGTW